MDWLGRIFKKTTMPVPNDFADVTDAPGSSLWALKRRQEAVGETLRAHVYCYDGKTLLITSMTRPDSGPTTETGAATILPIDASNEDVGRAVCAHLLAYARTEAIDGRNTKLADWVVFKASGAESGKSFESKSHFIRVSTSFQSVAMEAAPYRRAYDVFCVKGSARPVHEDIGAMVRKVLKGVDALREKGLI